MKVYLTAIAKNENKYLREFVEYYHTLQIDKIILYDNNDPNGERFEDVIGDYIDEGFVKVINIRGINPLYNKYNIHIQAYVYREAYRKYSNKCDWMCFFDIDEFLVLDAKYKNDIHNFVTDHIFDNFDSIKVCWLLFDDNDKIHYEEGSLFKRFPRVSPNGIKDFPPQIKSIVRTKKTIEFIGIHGRLSPEVKFCNSEGKPSYYIIRKGGSFINNYSYKNAYIAHFRFKTISEYIDTKMKRGYMGGNTHNRFSKYNLDFFFMFNKKTPEKLAYLKSIGINYV